MCRTAFILLLLVIVQSTFAARIKDIAQIVGMRENPLMGMGLVVGLQKSGDKSPAALKALRNLLQRHSFKISQLQLATGNVALVMVTAKLPPMARKGSHIDIHVSSVGDAKSLAGGVLLTTFLKALNGKTYAVAQGILSQSDSTLPTVAMVSSGAIVEREVPMGKLGQNGQLLLRLKKPDFNTANRIAKAINKLFGPSSQAVDMSIVKIRIPHVYRIRNNIAEFIAQMYNLQVTPDMPARIVINERTGTIIVGELVTISPVTIAHNNITVEIAREVASEPEVTAKKFTQALFSLGINPRDIVAIFRMLDRMGALHAQLIVS